MKYEEEGCSSVLLWCVWCVCVCRHQHQMCIYYHTRITPNMEIETLPHKKNPSFNITMKNVCFLALFISSLVYEGQADTKCCCCGGAQRGMSKRRMSEGEIPKIRWHNARSAEFSEPTTDHCNSQQGKCNRLMKDWYQSVNQKHEENFEKKYGKRIEQVLRRGFVFEKENEYWNY